MSNISITTGSGAEWRERLAKLIVYWIWGLLFLYVLSLIAEASGYRLGWDSTDGDRTRSGLSLYVDHGTGCQYLGRSGALTPRLGPDGKPMGCRS